MAVVYIDEVFALNALMDYLLVLCAAKLAGEPLRRGRFALAALVGGLYAAITLLPGWGFLASPACKLAWAMLLCLVAYGGSKRLLRLHWCFSAWPPPSEGAYWPYSFWAAHPKPLTCPRCCCARRGAMWC